MSRRWLSLLALSCVSALAGCYGQTDLATNIGVDSATLNGRGTTDDGPADVWFEYWPTGNPANVSRTPQRRIPGGITHPIAQRVAGLAEGTSYTFRLCGRDVGETQTLCAQTRRLVAGRVNVQAWGTAESFDLFVIEDLDLDAFAADGGHGFFNYFTGRGGRLATGSHADGNVTCVSADGDSAGIAFETGYPAPGPQIARFTLFDRGPAGSGADRLNFGFTEDPDACSPRGSYQDALPLRGDVAISAPEPQPTAR